MYYYVDDVEVDGINESCSMPDKMKNAYKTSVVKPDGSGRPCGRFRRRVESNVMNRLRRNGVAEWELIYAVQGMSLSQHYGGYEFREMRKFLASNDRSVIGRSRCLRLQKCES
jgi:hypothetical protein